MKITGEMWNAFENAAKERISFKAFTEGFSAALAAAPTPPAPEVEPAAWISRHKGGDNLTWEPEEKSNTPLYTRPDNDRLRKAAEVVVAVFDKQTAGPLPCWIVDSLEHLRAELSKLK